MLEQVDDLGMRGSNKQGFMLSQGDGCRGEWQRTRQRYQTPASKIYTTMALISSDCNIFCTPRGERATVGSNAPGAFLVSKETVVMRWWGK